MRAATISESPADEDLSLCYTIQKGGTFMKPLQLSPETAIKLSKALGVPLEQLMHMPQHILIQKLVELEKQNKEDK